MKKTIKIKFTGFPPYHDPHQQAYYRFLCDRYDVCESDEPDYILDGGQSFHHMKYDCIKILICSENDVPDFNAYDYAVGCQDLQFGDRYVRFPWFAAYAYFQNIRNRKTSFDESLLKRKFCSFVVSNAEFGDPLRKKFFERLSKYKKVDSGGRYMNNMGGPVADKLAFCRDYKFNIAFENSSSPGYTTEKIMEAYVAQTVPIYYGDPDVAVDFRPESMVHVQGEDDIERAVEEIIRLDQDDDAYMKMVTAPCLTESDLSVYEARLNGFLASIFDRPLADARRRCRYGHQAMMARHLKWVCGLDQRMRDSALYAGLVNVAARVRGWSRR